MLNLKNLFRLIGARAKPHGSAEDVLSAVLYINAIKRVKASNGHLYFYIIPPVNLPDYNKKIVKLFRNNGVVLRSHYSEHYDQDVYRVLDKNQQFLVDVEAVYNDGRKIREIRDRYAKSAHKSL